MDRSRYIDRYRLIVTSYESPFHSLRRRRVPLPDCTFHRRIRVFHLIRIYEYNISNIIRFEIDPFNTTI